MGRQERRKLGMEMCWKAGKHFEINFSTQLIGIFGPSLHYSFVCFCA